MGYDIVLGRDKTDLTKFGDKGTILVAKQYVTMGQTTSLSNNIYMDVTRAHVVFVAGKHGSGKSYTLGAIAEGAVGLPTEVSQNLSFILLDTMGIYWTMRYPNVKEKPLLEQWGLQGNGLQVRIFTPKGFFTEYQKNGIPTDYPFSIRPAELQPQDWFLTFGLEENNPLAVFIENIIHQLQVTGKNYDVDDILTSIEVAEEDRSLKIAAKNRFQNAQSWGVFDKQGTPLEELAKGGTVTVLDVSCYATAPNGWEVKSLVVGLVAQKLFNERMLSRKQEELDMIKQTTTFGTTDADKKLKNPLVWLVVDEAHEFLPFEGKTTASPALITILREGRQPGISLILTTQQPGKIHTDVMTQADIILCHHITAQLDINALKMLSASYMSKGIDEHLRILPRVAGAVMIIDDKNERMFSARIRPRSTWHGGEAPTAMREGKTLF